MWVVDCGIWQTRGQRETARVDNNDNTYNVLEKNLKGVSYLVIRLDDRLIKSTFCRLEQYIFNLEEFKIVRDILRVLVTNADILGIRVQIYQLYQAFLALTGNQALAQHFQFQSESHIKKRNCVENSTFN